jgi:hypothetical protein
MSSYVRVLHASHDRRPFDVFVNDNCINKGLSYCDFTDYHPVTNRFRIRLCPPGHCGVSYFDSSFDMSGREIYTLAAVRNPDGRYDLVPVSDRPSHWHRDRAHIKFVNLSHGLHGADAYLDDGTMLFKNVPFKGITHYTTLHPRTYTLQVRHNGTGSTVLHVPNQYLSGARAYTAYAVGAHGGDPPLQMLTPLDGSSYLERDTPAAGRSTIDTKQADVNGDGVMDRVILTGNRSGQASAFTDNISVCVEDGQTGQRVCATPPFNEGYNPSLFTGNFTYDRAADILVRIESGGSGGYLYAYVYSLRDGRLVKLFDSDQFNAANQYDVVFKDDYRVEVTRTGSGQKYTIDLSRRKDDYADIYDQNGRLIRPVTGGVLGLGRLDPVDVDNDGYYELVAYQRIIGRYNADTLGYIKTTLRWDGSKFVQVGSKLTTA